MQLKGVRRRRRRLLLLRRLLLRVPLRRLERVLVQTQVVLLQRLELPRANLQQLRVARYELKMRELQRRLQHRMLNVVAVRRGLGVRERRRIITNDWAATPPPMSRAEADALCADMDGVGARRGSLGQQQQQAVASVDRPHGARTSTLHHHQGIPVCAGPCRGATP